MMENPTKTDHGKCNCLYCTSKCPECGSIYIDVNLKLGFSYSNDHKNQIRISREADEIELSCNECGASIEEGVMFEGGRLDKLLAALCESMEIPSRFDVTIDKKGEINIESYLTYYPPRTE